MSEKAVVAGSTGPTHRVWTYKVERVGTGVVLTLNGTAYRIGDASLPAFLFDLDQAAEGLAERYVVWNGKGITREDTGSSSE